MFVKLSSSVGYDEIIHHFRTDIFARLLMDKDGPAACLGAISAPLAMVFRSPLAEMTKRRSTSSIAE